MPAATTPLRLTDHPGLWQMWSLAATPGNIWVAPLDAAARASLPKKGAGSTLIEIEASRVLEPADESLPPTLF